MVLDSDKRNSPPSQTCTISKFFPQLERGEKYLWMRIPALLCMRFCGWRKRRIVLLQFFHDTEQTRFSKQGANVVVGKKEMFWAIWRRVVGKGENLKTVPRCFLETKKVVHTHRAFPWAQLYASQPNSGLSLFLLGEGTIPEG